MRRMCVFIRRALFISEENTHTAHTHARDARDARDARAMDALGADELRHVVGFLSPVDLLLAGRVNRVMRAAVVEITRGCDIDLSPSSSGEVNMTTLRSALLMSREEADACEFEVEERRGGYGRYATYVLKPSVAMERAVRTLGGWEEVARRVERKRERKRKREDLGLRQIEAVKKRCAALDTWAKKTKLLGKHTTVEGWIKAHSGTCVVSQELRDYVEKPVLKPPLKVDAAKEALQATVKAENERGSRRVELVAALDRLKLALRPDSSLCSQFLNGDSPHSSQTVAATMAYMHWLHSHTNSAYKQAVRAEVQSLRDDTGRYFDGINREAAEAVKLSRKFAPPAKWPWLDDEEARFLHANPKLALRR